MCTIIVELILADNKIKYSKIQIVIYFVDQIHKSNLNLFFIVLRKINKKRQVHVKLLQTTKQK